MVSKIQKHRYERARRTALREVGVRTIDEALDKGVYDKYIDVFNAALRSEEEPEATKAAEVSESIAPPSDVRVDAAVEIVEERAPAAEVEDDKSKPPLVITIKGSGIKTILQPPIERFSTYPALIDGLDFISLFDFTVFRGYAGIGKTSSVERWAHDNGYDVYEFVASEEMNTFDLVGSYIIQGGDVVFNATPITSALANSERHKTLLIIDEINLLRSAVLKSLNDLTDFRKSVDTVVGRFVGKDIHIVGLMNAESTSAGNPLDLSVVSRAFVHEVSVPFVVSTLLKSRLISKALGDVMTKTTFVFGLREVAQLKLLVKHKIDRPIDMLLQKYDTDVVRAQVLEAFKLIYGSEYNSKCVADITANTA